MRGPWPQNTASVMEMGVRVAKRRMRRNSAVAAAEAAAEGDAPRAFSYSVALGAACGDRPGGATRPVLAPAKVPAARRLFVGVRVPSDRLSATCDAQEDL